MIAVSEPSLTSVERNNLLDAFDSGWVSSRGKYLDLAEAALRKLTGTSYVAVVSSGTTALHLSLLALGVGPGDEVIIPSSTYVATLNAVLYVGASPVIVDVDEHTWCIDVQAVCAAITPATKAVIAVDLYGHPADYAGLRRVVEPRGIPLVADAAESIGATVKGAPSGSLADISIFSFFGNKVVTSGEGGAVLTASASVFHRICQLRNQGSDPSKRYFHEILGYNYRMTNMAAAVLVGQLSRIDDLLTLRRRVYTWYDQLLSTFPLFRVQSRDRSIVSSPWLYTGRLVGCTSEQRDHVIARMADAGIETRPAFIPMQAMPYLQDLPQFTTPVAMRLAQEGISLPTHPGLGRSDIQAVVEALRAAMLQ